MMKYTDICKATKLEPILKTKVIYITNIIYKREIDLMLDMLTIKDRLGAKIYLKEPNKVHFKALLDQQSIQCTDI